VPAAAPFRVLVDFAHTDDALANVLSALRPLTAGRLILVFGCGGDRDRTKRPRMAAVAERWADAVVVTSDNPRSEDPQAIINEILTGFSPAGLGKVKVLADRRAAIAAALTQAGPGDLVLLAGKGHENYQILGSRRIHFDDVETAGELLRERRGR
jgi:UDP-N-acetylmuramoyl-L-alanyl-D-glutamate--2,6-diaminopimelate ligase